MKFVPGIILALLMAAIVAPLSAQDGGSHLDHRDDYEMESISGGDFRGYVSEYITEENAWAYSMQTLGNFHNLMHELMSDLARHAEIERDDSGSIPDFENRISGGEWREMRKALEEKGEQSYWREFVQITEIMHDRVHHVMAKTLQYDKQTNNREVDLTDYLRTEPLPLEKAVPGDDGVNVNSFPESDFRQMVWEYDIDTVWKHRSFQKMAVFSQVLYDLLNQWGTIAADHNDPECRPSGQGRMTEARWTEYASQIEGCSDETWKEVVLLSELMKNRIHHMMYKMVKL